MKLPLSFFNRDAAIVAQELLGQLLVTTIDNKIVRGIIVETESYCGEDDQACHARFGRTKRSETLYGEPGRLYIYLNYGIFYLVNVVCGPTDCPAAVLLRSVEITEGQAHVKERLARNKFVKENDRLATGPGKLAIAFGLTNQFNNIDATKSKEVFFEKKGKKIDSSDIIKTTRIGIDYAGESKDSLWRFYIKNNTFVSKK